MFFRKTINKTKNFFCKTLKNFRSFIFGGYQKLPKAQPLIPFSTNATTQQMHHLDSFYREFSENWESDTTKKILQRKKKTVMSKKEPMIENNAREGNSADDQMQSDEKNEIVDYSCLKNTKGRGRQLLAGKMKELELMDANDVDHVLDIEEIVHYYSRLTCPVYIDLVDTFFMKIYSEFLIPPALIVQ